MRYGIPRRLRLAFDMVEHPVDPSRPGSAEPDAEAALVVAGMDEQEFVAYAEDCILSGRTVLDRDRFTDMLNDHDEYALIGVTVERIDGGSPMAVAEILVERDEIILVHASGPRGDASRRHRTMPQALALQMGPYRVRGFVHTLPGADVVYAFRRRKVMVPLTEARIEYTIGGEQRDVRVGTVIVNRDQVDWLMAIEPGAGFPETPGRSDLPARTRRRVRSKNRPLAAGKA